FLFQFKNYKIDNSLDSWFLKNDKNLLNYEKFKKDFGNDEVISIVFTLDSNITDKKNIIFIKNIEDSIKNIEQINKVYSYANTMQSFFISKDKKTTLIIVEPVVFPCDSKLREQTIAKLKEVLDKKFINMPFSYHLAGIGIIYNELNQLSLNNSTIFIFASYILIFLLLTVFIRKPLFIASSLVVIVFSITISLGFMFLMGRSINMVSMVLPVLIMIYCISDIIHITNNYLTNCKGSNKTENIVNALKECFFPCFLTSFTTGIGFISLYFTKIQLLRDFALFASFGIMLEYILTIVLLPILFSFIPEKYTKTNKEVKNIFIDIIYNIIKINKLKIIISCFIIIFMFIIGIFFLKVDTFSIGFLDKNNTVRKDSNYIEKNYGFYTPLEMICYGKKETFLDNKALKAVDLFIQKVKKNENIDKAITITTFIPYITSINEKENIRNILENTSLLKNTVKKYIINDYSTLRVTISCKMLGAADYKKIIDFIIKEGDFLKEYGIELKTSGYMPLYTKIISYITESQIYSFLFSFIIVFSIITIYAGSFRLALFSIFANILPLAFTLGLMGFCGIRLDIATVTISAIAIGITVDDTIHFLYRFKKEQSIQKTFLMTGWSICETSLIFIVGFSVLLLASIKSVIFFGLLIMIFIFVSLVGDLIFLPSLIMQFIRKNNINFKLD
ncbi:MAG: hypothetical protein A2Z98_18770, partial [Spirochaetes bacterium GWB1_27_13]